jgi:2-phosphoglycerate kinase
MFSHKRSFDILLLGGASGTGKTTAAYQLSKYYKINVVQIDDFQCLVENATKESDYPVFHYWKNHFNEAIKQTMDKKLEIMISYANELSKLLELVVLNHLNENTPMILEGDFISPNLCKKLLNNSQIGYRVRCCIITENSTNQIINNYQKREGSIQEDRAELSQKYNNWLIQEAKGSDISIVSSRPWKSIKKRIIEKIY